jgi:hypothetical protein
LLKTQHPFVEAAEHLIVKHTTVGERPAPTEPADKPQKLELRMVKWRTEQERARVSMADMVAAAVRDGITLKEIDAGFAEMRSVRRGEKIKEHEYRRLWGYLPPKRT